MLPLRFVYAKMDAFAIQSNRVLNSQRVFKRSNNISPRVSEISTPEAAWTTQVVKTLS